jgi:membrane protein required for colicin V production
MNALDFFFIFLFAAGILLGLMRGFMRILIGILSLVVAFFLASRYRAPLAQILIDRRVAETPAEVTAYIAIFLATMIAGGLVAWLVGKLLKLAMLSWADRFAGGALGFVAAGLAAAFLVHPLVVSSKGGSQALAHSKLAPYVAVVADIGNALTPDTVAKRYESGMESLRKVWRGDMPEGLAKVKDKVGEAVDAGAKAAKQAVETTEDAVKDATKKK